MSRFAEIFWPALLAGLVAGILAAGLEQAFVMPLLHDAENLEGTREAVRDERTASADHHDQHDQAEWKPVNGAERTAYSVLANIVVGIGYAFLLGAGLALARATGRAITFRRGLLWGLAGFAAFALAPALSLPPEIPGEVAAALRPRQGWWVLTAICTASAIALLVYGRRRPVLVGFAAALIVLPHLAGAPVAPSESDLALRGLHDRFVPVAMAVNLAFWLVLGGISGWLHQRWGDARMRFSTD